MPTTHDEITTQRDRDLSGDPGVLSGGTVVPAAVARMIAHEPGGTWHRMRTDEAGHLVEPSTTSYQPTGPIWEHVVAEHATCFRPACDAPSTTGDLDHRTAWPLGPTDTEHLWPGCRTDHRTKHAPGFAIEQAAGLRDWDELIRPRSPELHWEDDVDDGLSEAEWHSIWGLSAQEGSTTLVA